MYNILLTYRLHIVTGALWTLSEDKGQSACLPLVLLSPGSVIIKQAHMMLTAKA